MTSTGALSGREQIASVFPARYLIIVRGCLEGSGWADWFGPLQISIDRGRDETTLRGLVTDQAELYGLLSRLRNLALPLLLVKRLEAASPE
jgi:hypothetical protein